MSEQADFDALLDYLARTRGFDFTGYKPASVMRRVTKRMHEVGVEGFAEYLDHLEVHPDEFEALFNTILINVTAFFRDGEAWDRVRDVVLPRILERKSPSDPIRVWSAGCASGQEAYSAALMFADVLGHDDFRSRVKVYGTDVDEDALTEARLGSYDAKEIAEVPDPLRERYFDEREGRFVARKDLRSTVIFGRNDLVQDAPISRIDLLLCRNTLMYFHAETQALIIRRFNFALNPEGVLFLGTAEMLTRHQDLFTPLDPEHRLFTKVHIGRPRGLVDRVGAIDPDAAEHLAQIRVRAAAADTVPVAQVLLDPSDRLVAVNKEARELFGLGFGDIGRQLHDLRLSYQPAELRSAIDEIKRVPRPIEVGEVRWTTPSGDARRLEVRLDPLLTDGDIEGVSVVFVDVTPVHDLQGELEHTRHAAETAFEELQSTSEELETTNEELQSTNEELETTNEELQSTNEELGTINEQLRERTVEVQSANAFLEGILGGLPASVIVVDRDLCVHLWNQQSEELWGLRADEVRGQHLLNLDIGLPVDELKDPVRGCLADGAEPVTVELSAVNRRGQQIGLRGSCRPLQSSDGVTGAILMLNATTSRD